MKQPRQPLNRARFTLLLAAIAALGAALVLAREATYGVALSADSIGYMQVAGNLLAGKGFVFADDKPYTAWPPLYPMLLAAASLGVLDPADAAGPLNAAIFGLTIFVAGQYLRRRLESRFLILWACLALALAAPMLELASWAVSEPAFILLATLALAQADRFLGEGKTSLLVWAAVFSALAWQTRYIGLAVPVAVGALLLLQPGASLPQRARRFSLHALIVALPMALWMLRNDLLVGNFRGQEELLRYSLQEMMRQAEHILLSRMYFGLTLGGWPVPALLAVAASALAAASCIRGAGKRRKMGRSDWRPFCVFGGFALAYLTLGIVALRLGFTSAGLHWRYVPPLYTPILICVALGLDRLLECARCNASPDGVGNLPSIRAGLAERLNGAGLLAASLMTALALYLAGQVALSVRQISLANSGDLFLGYSSPRWNDSETLRHIRENPMNGAVHSNYHLLVHLNNGGTATYHKMPKNRRGSSVIDEPKVVSDAGPELLRFWLDDADAGAYLVWFHGFWMNSHFYDYGVAAMRMLPGLEPVAQLSDGAIFRVNREYAPALNPYQAAQASILAGNYGMPAVLEDFAVYRATRTLYYFKEPCSAADAQPRFILHIYPVDAAKLSAHRRQYGFDNLDFAFLEHGAILNDACLAIVPLPSYAISAIRTGQGMSGQERFWRAEF